MNTVSLTQYIHYFFKDNDLNDLVRRMKKELDAILRSNRGFI